MLLELAQWLAKDFRGFNVFGYITLRAVLATMTALTISFVFGPAVIRWLTAKKIGQSVRTDGPQTHLIKAGTPVPFKDLEALPLILPSQSQSIRNVLETEASRLNMQLNVVVQIVGPDFILDLVEQGRGYTVLPADALAMRHRASAFQQNEIVQPRLIRTLNVAIASGKRRTRLVSESVRLLQQYLQERPS